MTDNLPAVAPSTPARLSPVDGEGRRWGLDYPVPVEATACWGARGIDDQRSIGLLGDRQGSAASVPADLDCLLATIRAQHKVWNQTAFIAARNAGLLVGRERTTVLLWEGEAHAKMGDSPGMVRILGNNNASYGYVYLVAWIVPALGLPVTPLDPKVARIILPLDKPVSARTLTALEEIRRYGTPGSFLRASRSMDNLSRGILTPGHTFCIEQGYAMWDKSRLVLTPSGSGRSSPPARSPSPRPRPGARPSPRATPPTGGGSHGPEGGEGVPVTP